MAKHVTMYLQAGANNHNHSTADAARTHPQGYTPLTGQLQRGSTVILCSE